MRRTLLSYFIWTLPVVAGALALAHFIGHYGLLVLFGCFCNFAGYIEPRAQHEEKR